MNRILAVLTALALTGCVANYSGRMPDLSKRGEAAEEEFRKFELHDNWWTSNPGYFTMGPSETFYPAASLKPVMQMVSPEAVEKERIAQQWHYGKMAFVIAASLFIVFERDSWQSDDWLIFSGLLLTGSGIGLYANHIHRQSVEIHNRDLKEKLSPKLTYNLTF